MIILETARLIFRHHEPSDLEEFCSLEQDPQVRQFVGGRAMTREEAESRFRRIFLRQRARKMALWATELKETGEYAGYCGVYSEGTKGSGKLAFYLARKFWRKGYATEAAFAFLDHGFVRLGLDRIIGSVEIGNEASERILRKIGMTLFNAEIGEKRSFRHYVKDNPNKKVEVTPDGAPRF